jgi:hypothetical protein
MTRPQPAPPSIVPTCEDASDLFDVDQAAGSAVHCVPRDIAARGGQPVAQPQEAPGLQEQLANRELGAGEDLYIQYGGWTKNISYSSDGRPMGLDTDLASDIATYGWVDMDETGPGSSPQFKIGNQRYWLTLARKSLVVRGD